LCRAGRTGKFSIYTRRAVVTVNGATDKRWATGTPAATTGDWALTADSRIRTVGRETGARLDREESGAGLNGWLCDGANRHANHSVQIHDRDVIRHQHVPLKLGTHDRLDRWIAEVGSAPDATSGLSAHASARDEDILRGACGGGLLIPQGNRVCRGLRKDGWITGTCWRGWDNYGRVGLDVIAIPLFRLSRLPQAEISIEGFSFYPRDAAILHRS